jgi:uridine kinase
MQKIVQNVNQLVHIIQSVDTHKIRIIGISGFGGSGKSTLSHQLAPLLPHAEIISFDDFIIDSTDTKLDGWANFDRNRLIDQVLIPITNDIQVSYNVFDWKKNNSVGKRTLQNGTKTFIIEGVGLFHPLLMRYFSSSIWVDISLNTATQQGVARDHKLGIENQGSWDNVWRPNEELFVSMYHPQDVATILFRQDSEM